jgi:type I restriction enzyme R subunit
VKCELKDVAEIYDGTHQTPKYQSHGIMFLSVENITNLSSKKYISQEAFDSEFSIRPEKGDVLMTRIGDIGTANVVESEQPIAYYVSLALFKSTKLNPYFLKNSIHSPEMINDIWRRTLHIAFPKKINKNEIGNVSIYVPTIDEQTKIGYLFNSLDDLITVNEHKQNKRFSPAITRIFHIIKNILRKISDMIQNKNLAEEAFQEATVRGLTGKYDNVKSWTAPDFLDGTKHKVTYQTLIDNWRHILNQQNTKELEGHDLTDAEFQQVLSKVNTLENSYQAAKLLASENGVGKIDGIIRDNNLAGVTHDSITLRIFEKAKVNGGDTVYQLAREVWTENDRNRFDILLLINGLPLINIEQKRVDKNADEAFGQFRRYYQDGEYTNNFFVFSQMMVIMTDIDTRYFATPKTLEAFNPAFQFHWADSKNQSINSMTDVVKTLLRIPMAHQMVGDYLIINEDTRDSKNQYHILMRPYQVEALRAIEYAAAGKDIATHVPHGGFVWHTTGSGKTITSFKAALSLSKTFDKVIFLLDRKDLDAQTSKNFKAYSQYETIEVSDSPHTHDLRESLSTSLKGVVVATTFKLNNVIKELQENGDDKSILKKRMAVIVDEAHRTTMGEMMQTIKSALRNTLFFGFTGTPLFDESNTVGFVNEYSERMKTTEDMFGKELHRYTIDEAIKDKNVLGFHVDYIDTGEIGSYSLLKEKWLAHEKADPLNKRSDDELTRYALQLENDRKTDKDGINIGRAELEIVLEYHDELHIPQVVKSIIENWEKHSNGSVNGKKVSHKFNGLLTVALKQRVIAYYDEFKKQLAESNLKLNIMATFSTGNENTDLGQKDKDNLATIFQDWHEMGHPLYQVDATKLENGESGFFSDITAVFKNGGHANNEKNIDLLIVADRLLTGYDSKLLNTLYVDRYLKLQGLIQAYSRTNRIYGEDKEFGTIVNFQYPAKSRYALERALKLYGSGGTSSRVIVDEYAVVVKQMVPLFETLQESLAYPERWLDIKDVEPEQTDFIIAFRQVAKKLNLLQQYYEFDWLGTGIKALAFSEETWLKYLGAYQNLKPKIEDGPEDEIADLVGGTQLIDTQDITFSEIIRLIGKLTTPSGQLDQSDANNAENERLITDAIQKLRTFGDNDNAELLEKFMADVVTVDKLDNHLSVADNYQAFRIKTGQASLEAYAKTWAIDQKILLKVYQHYHVGDKVINYLDELKSSNDYLKSDWYQNPENATGGLPALRYKNDLENDLLNYLFVTKSIYGEF